MTKDEHKQRHVELHAALDELVSDFINFTGKLPTQTTVSALVEWSYAETLKPTESEPPE